VELIPEDMIIDINKEFGNHIAIISKHTITSYEASLDYYPNDKCRIAAIVRSLIKNHSFSNGNKKRQLSFYCFCVALTI
jgi:prophage maintenance system killer protein